MIDHIVYLPEFGDRLRRHGPVAGGTTERSEGLLVETLQEQGHRLYFISPKMTARTRPASPATAPTAPPSPRSS